MQNISKMYSYSKNNVKSVYKDGSGKAQGLSRFHMKFSPFKLTRTVIIRTLISLFNWIGLMVNELNKARKQNHYLLL